MSKRPTDLDALIMPKEADPAPVRPPVAEEAPARGYAHTLSYRMTTEQYRQLRRFVADEEERTGKRVTHQAIIEAAVTQWLKEARKR